MSQESNGPFAEHRGYYNRGYLPHFDAAHKQQLITFRLADSLPQNVIDAWRDELQGKPDEERKKELSGRCDRFLDTSRGSCLLREPHCAETVVATLRHDDGISYDLLAYVIMPNHVHVLIQQLQGKQLAKVVQAWKSVSAKRINALRSTSGTVWQMDYWDRYIRDENHFCQAISYIQMNPAKAGLVEQPEGWPYTWVKT